MNNIPIDSELLIKRQRLYINRLEAYIKAELINNVCFNSGEVENELESIASGELYDGCIELIKEGE